MILMTAYGSKETAIEALNEGAAYYVEKPFDLDEMKVVARRTIDQKRIASENADLKTENRGLKAELKGRYRFEGLIGRSSKMKAIFQLIERVAGTGSTIVISGESGTGKELIARAIHYNSGRGDQLVRVDQLRRAPRRAARERAVRPHEGLVHRCRRDEEGALRGRRRRDDLPRRDRRDDAGDADQAAPRPSRARHPPRRGHGGDSRRGRA